MRTQFLKFLVEIIIIKKAVAWRYHDKPGLESLGLGAVWYDFERNFADTGLIRISFNPKNTRPDF